MRDQKNASNKGLLAEVKFELECLNRNILISKPIHPKSVYDYIIDINNKLYKIQVKFTSCKSPAGSFRITVFKGSSSKKSKRESYTTDDIDYIAGLTSDNDWFLIPMNNDIKTCFTLCNKYNIYKNNWTFEK